jgi:hypothetical protein
MIILELQWPPRVLQTLVVVVVEQTQKTLVEPPVEAVL